MLQPKDRLRMSDVKHVLGPRLNGRPIGPATLHRWYTVGLRGIVLKTIMEGGIRVTTRQWLDQFFQELTAAREKAVEDTARKRVASRRKKEATSHAS